MSISKRVIKVIKANEKRESIASHTIRKFSEVELREERVATVNNWISEHRANDSQEKAFVRSGIKAWRESNLSAVVNKI